MMSFPTSTTTLPPHFQDAFPFMVNNRSRSSFDSFTEVKVAMGIWKVGAPLLLVVGTVGNILSIVVLSRKKLRKITTMFYLAVLAFADLAVLYTGLLRLWMDNVLGVYIRLGSDTACRIHLFFVYYSLGFSVWILVAVTADRCLFVSAPFRAKRWCSLRQARIVVAVIASVLFLINMHYLWTVSVIYHGTENLFGDETKSCYTSQDPSTKVFIEKVWPWIDFCVVCLIPFVIMLVLNSLIIRHLLVSTRRLRAHSEIEARPEEEPDPAEAKATVIENLQHTTFTLGPVTDTGKAQQDVGGKGSAHVRGNGSVGVRNNGSADVIRDNDAADVRCNGSVGIRRCGSVDDRDIGLANVEANSSAYLSRCAGEEHDDVFEPPPTAELRSEIPRNAGSTPVRRSTDRNATSTGLSRSRPNAVSDGRRRRKDNNTQQERAGLDLQQRLSLGPAREQFSPTAANEDYILPPAGVMENTTTDLPSTIIDRNKADSDRVWVSASREDCEVSFGGGRKPSFYLPVEDCTQSTGLDRHIPSRIHHSHSQAQPHNNGSDQGEVLKEEGFSFETKREFRGQGVSPVRYQSTKEQGKHGCFDPHHINSRLEADEACPANQQDQGESRHCGEKEGELQQIGGGQTRLPGRQNYVGQQQDPLHQEQTETRNRQVPSTPITSSLPRQSPSPPNLQASPRSWQLNSQQNGKHDPAAAPKENGPLSYTPKEQNSTPVRATKHQNGNHSQTLKQQNGNPTKTSSTPSAPSPTRPNPPPPPVPPPAAAPAPAPAQRQLNRSLTVMLLTVNALFYLLTAPIVVFMIGYPYWAPGATGRSMAQLSLGWVFVNMLQYTNNAVHFFLYCLTGPRFRQELRALCSRSPRRRATVAISMH